MLSYHHYRRTHQYTLPRIATQHRTHTHPITYPTSLTIMPVFTSPSLRLRRATRSTTAPPNGNQADAAMPTPTSDAPTSPADRPTSPEQPPLESDTFALKARRAYDRDRQRTHQRKERARRELERSTSLAAPPIALAHSRENTLP